MEALFSGGGCAELFVDEYGELLFELVVLVVVAYVVFRLGIPLNVFLSNDVGNADGFCLRDPVPNWLNFEGLITELDGDELFVIVLFLVVLIVVLFVSGAV